jgi:hypothetical protein
MTTATATPAPTVDDILRWQWSRFERYVSKVCRSLKAEGTRVDRDDIESRMSLGFWRVAKKWKRKPSQEVARWWNTALFNIGRRAKRDYCTELHNRREQPLEYTDSDGVSVPSSYTVNDFHECEYMDLLPGREDVVRELLSGTEPSELMTRARQHRLKKQMQLKLAA